MPESVVLPAAPEPLEGVVPSLDNTVLGQCWNGVAQMLIAMQIPGIADRVRIRRSPHPAEGETLPACYVSHLLCRRDDQASGTAKQAWHYLYTVGFVWASGRAEMQGEYTALAAYEQTVIEFGRRPVDAGVFPVSANGGGLVGLQVDSAQSLNEWALQNGYLVKFLVIDCLVRLPYRNNGGP